LADYVFFPLSQILRRKKQYTDTLSEITIKCIRILLEYGWSRTIALDLAKQLLILLTFVAGGVPGQASTPVSEELVVEAYAALAALFLDLKDTPGGAASMVETGTIPALGHCMTVILDGITDGPTAEAQLQALKALDAIWRCIKDQQALSNFLPGTISALTKSLMPTTTNRRSRKCIVTALEVLEHVLVSILSDIRTRNIKEEDSASNGEQKTLTISWLKATAGQIKLALSNIIRLRSNNSTEVRTNLNKLCLTILDECHDTLAESSSVLVETSMILSEVAGEDTLRRSTTLIDLATIHPDLGELIKVTVYNWVTSLPRVMQSNDETTKRMALEQLSKAHVLLTSLDLDSSVLEDALVNSLRDSVTTTLEPSNSTKLLQETEFDMNSQAAMTLASDNTLVTTFSPIILPQESQKGTRTQLLKLINSFGARQSQIKMASEMLNYVRGASGPGLLSAYWLSSQLLKSATANDKDLDEFFNASLTLSDGQEIVNQELFSYSLFVLSGDDESSNDWRLQAIALEVIADSAEHLGEEFRTELVDTLYPITQLLGSTNSKLREHAITCLNIVSKACGYANASELIIDNVDYMVNAISLRLNTFDISPQAPQVLVMMIRLTGPSLLPYLDDVVGSIFAALDNFHGYHRLVEILFSVLGEIVDTGSKSGQLQITGIASVSHRKTGSPIPTIEEILLAIEKKQSSSDDSLPYEDFPHAPWRDAKTLLDETDNPPTDPDTDPEPPSEIAKPPPTKTYTMLRNIARLGQHYLTSSSPILRTKLLSLMTTACTALYQNEDEFLPLINDIWPVIIARLYDDEPYVCIAAADTVAEICRCAGDFLGTRIRTEWVEMMKIVRRVKREMGRDKGGRGLYSMVSRVWEGIVRLLVAIVGYVRVDDDMFDEVLEVLRSVVVERGEVRKVLEEGNADAVWFVMQRAGKNETREMPIVEGYTFAVLESGVEI